MTRPNEALFDAFPVDIDNLPVDQPFELPASEGLKQSYHRFQHDHILAIEAAWYAQRPLLIRGDPGLGKSQLAHAVARCLDWNFIMHVVHSRTEPDDLLYRVDHVARLAKAQLLQAELGGNKRLAGDEGEEGDAENEGVSSMTAINHQNFIVPGPLWWAYAPESANGFFANPENDYTSQYKPKKGKPFVILIDEIDKAQRDLPNALLEVLNNQSFHVPFYDEPISSHAKASPFVVITSNDERPLPDAFLRRCVVLNMQMAQGEAGEKQLIEIAKAHKLRLNKLGKSVIETAAKTVIEYRDKLSDGDYKPGTSEYLDMLRVLNDHKAYTDDPARIGFLEKLIPYLLQKS